MGVREMRRRLVITVGAGVLAAVAVGTAGCTRNVPVGAPPAQEVPAGDWPAGVKEAEVYALVLGRYLSTPAESSFNGRFKTVYVLDHVLPDAARELGTRERGTAIAENTQRHIKSALAGVAQVVFIANGDTVIEDKDTCAHVRNGDILIDLGPVNGDDREAQVYVGGFVGCVGASGVTYVVRNQPDTGWRVKGTTGGPRIVA